MSNLDRQQDVSGWVPDGLLITEAVDGHSNFL